MIALQVFNILSLLVGAGAGNTEWRLLFDFLILFPVENIQIVDYGMIIC